MSAVHTRLLHPAMLPVTLWDAGADLLILPPALANAYQTVIDRHGLRQLAESRDRNNAPIGGLTRERAAQHFTQAFDGSAARTQLALLDPRDEIAHASDAFIRCLAGNDLCLIDAPCGADAAAFAFLTNIAELRAASVLPREPLEVTLIGAELSEPARDYARQMFQQICPALQEQAIFVNYLLQHWDVTDTLSNTDLISAMTRASDPTGRRLVVVANFNGFLERERKRSAAEPQIEELFRHASGGNSVAIWIEPVMNEAVVERPGRHQVWPRV